ncbi:hypothetical protein OSTOST_18800, partial [Ostertagia ostertagi]
MIPYVPIKWNSFTLTLSLVKSAPTPLLNTPFITDGNSTAIWNPQLTPLLECQNRSQAQTFDCNIANKCVCYPAETQANCNCENLNISAWIHDLRHRLPLVFPSVIFKRDREGQVHATIPSMTTAEIIMTMQGNLETDILVDEATCSISNTSSLRFSFDTARIHQKCRASCGQSVTIFEIGGLLKYPHTASNMVDRWLRGETSSEPVGFHWPDFPHILDVFLMWYKTLLSAVLALLVLLVLTYILISAYGIRVTKWILKTVFRILTLPVLLFFRGASHLLHQQNGPTKYGQRFLLHLQVSPRTVSQWLRKRPNLDDRSYSSTSFCLWNSEKNDWEHLKSNENFVLGGPGEQVLLIIELLRTAEQAVEQIKKLATRFVLTDRLFEALVQNGKVNPSLRRDWLRKKHKFDVEADKVLEFVVRKTSDFEKIVDELCKEKRKAERRLNDSDQERRPELQKKQLLHILREEMALEAQSTTEQIRSLKERVKSQEAEIARLKGIIQTKEQQEKEKPGPSRVQVTVDASDGAKGGAALEQVPIEMETDEDYFEKMVQEVQEDEEMTDTEQEEEE